MTIGVCDPVRSRDTKTSPRVVEEELSTRRPSAITRSEYGPRPADPASLFTRDAIRGVPACRQGAARTAASSVVSAGTSPT